MSVTKQWSNKFGSNITTSSFLIDLPAIAENPSKANNKIPATTPRAQTPKAVKTAPNPKARSS